VRWDIKPFWWHIYEVFSNICTKNYWNWTTTVKITSHKHDASRSQWQEYVLEIGEILHIFPSGTQSVGDRGSKKAYTDPRTGIYLPTKFGCDQSIVVGCMSRNDWRTDKQNGMTIRVTLCDANVTQYYWWLGGILFGTQCIIKLSVHLMLNFWLILWNCMKPMAPSIYRLQVKHYTHFTCSR